MTLETDIVDLGNRTKLSENSSGEPVLENTQDGTAVALGNVITLSGGNINISQAVEFDDVSSDPSTNGVIQRNGGDVKVYSGGAVRNLSNVGGDTSTTSVEYWDGSSWNSSTDMPEARESFGAAADDSGNIFIFGGYDGNSALTSVKKFDGSSWTKVADIPVGRYRFGYVSF